MANTSPKQSDHGKPQTPPMNEQLDAGGKRYDVTQHEDGNWALSEEGSPNPVIVLGSREEIEAYVRLKFGPPTWL